MLKCRILNFLKFRAGAFTWEIFGGLDYLREFVLHSQPVELCNHLFIGQETITCVIAVVTLSEKHKEKEKKKRRSPIWYLVKYIKKNEFHRIVTL